MVLRVEDVVLDADLLERGAQLLRLFDGDRAHEHGLPALIAFADLIGDRVELLALGLVDDVGAVLTHHRAARRNDHDAEIVDLAEFLGFRLGRARHARELVVHAEVILERDACERLVL